MARAAREEQGVAIRRESRGTIIPRPGDDTRSKDLRRWSRRRWRGCVLGMEPAGPLRPEHMEGNTRDKEEPELLLADDPIFFASNAPTSGLEHPNRLTGSEIGDMAPSVLHAAVMREISSGVIYMKTGKAGNGNDAKERA